MIEEKIKIINTPNSRRELPPPISEMASEVQDETNHPSIHYLHMHAGWLNLYPPRGSRSRLRGAGQHGCSARGAGGNGVWGERDCPWLGTSIGIVRILEANTPRLETTGSPCALGRFFPFLGASLCVPSVTRES